MTIASESTMLSATASLRDRKRALALLVAVFCGGANANEADTNAAGTAAAAPGQASVLEEVIVTAQKREQSLQSVPIAVSALTAGDLEATGVQDVSDVSRQVPVLEVQSSVTPVFTNFRIRRVGNLGNIPTFEPAVGLFVDGAFRSRAIFGATELFDLERIEVLRGPQSTLYGKNTTAGVIGIYTAEPSKTFSATGEVTVGSIDGAQDATLTQAKASISGPFSDSFRASLGGSFTQHGETMGEALVNSGANANDANRYSARTQLSWDVTDAFNLRLILGTVQEDDKQQTSDLFIDPRGPLATIVLPAWRAAGISDTCTDNDPHNRITCVQQPLRTELDAREATLLADYSFANGVTLSSVTSWDYFLFNGAMDDVAQMMAPLLKFRDVQESDSVQQELRLASKGGQTIDWLTGAFYYTNDFKRGDDGKNPVFLGDTLSAHPVVAAVNQQLFSQALGVALPLLPMAVPGQSGFLASNLDTEYLGVYAQGTWNIVDSFGITAGARWQEEQKDANIRQWVDVPGASVISLALSPAAISGTGLSRKTDEVTWSVTPKWQMTDDAMLFATAAHGFKSGGYNIGFGRLPIAQREFGDEDIMHYEAGIKSQVASGRMQVSASVFQTEFDNYQDAAFVGGQFTVGNAEETLLKGAEIEAKALLGKRFTADASVSYASLRYVTNTHGQCYPGRAPDSQTTPRACDLGGERPVNAPELKTHLGLQYDQPASIGNLFARADWSWTSEYNTSFSADPRLKQPSYDWINLRAGVNFGSFDVALWADNLTNETVVNLDPVVTLYAAQTDGSYQSLLQDARSFGATLRVKF